MTDGSNERDDGVGSEAGVRMSPEFARRQRRRTLWAGVGGLGMGLAILVLGVDSVRTGQWVQFGSLSNSLELPGVVVILMALFLLFCGGALLRRSVRKA